MFNNLRSRQNKRLFAVMLSVGTLADIILFIINFWAGIIALVFSLVMIFICIYYINRRENELAKLNNYLVSLRHGIVFDIRKYDEGELSILQSEIFKSTNDLREKAENLTNDKVFLSDTLSDISHQLRTPLTAMELSLSLLQSEKTDENKRRELIKELDMLTQRIERLINMLLKLSRLDSGTVTMKKQKIPMKKLIDESLKPFLIPVELRLLELEVFCDSNLEVVCDLQWSAEAIGNIIKNCIEHTPEGGKISVVCSENMIYNEIKITDTGEGIDEDDQSHIFERFYKGKNSSPNSIGIGMAFAQTIMQKQNANIDVSSVLGEGTSFAIRFYKTVV